MKQVTIETGVLMCVETKAGMSCFLKNGYCTEHCTAAKIYPVIKLGDDGSETPSKVFECVAEPGCRIKFEVVG